MKRILVFSALLALLSCDKEEKGYVINAETQGFENGTKVYINTVSRSNRPTIIDSSTIENGKFKIALPVVEDADFNYISFANQRGNVIYIAENNPIQMTIYKDSLRSSKVVGGGENDLFFQYLNKMNEFAKEKQNLRNQYQVATKLKENDKLPQLIQKQSELAEEEKRFRRDLAEHNTGSLVSVIALTDLLNQRMAPAKEIKTIFVNVEDSLKGSRLGQNLDRLITSSIGKIDIGSEVDNFTAPNPSGEMVSLKDTMGKLTIIDFWASWCKPCRAENPNVVKVYKKYHDKGLNIIGVSLDKKKEAWVKAIEDDNLDWNHVSHLKFWQDPIAKEYGVRSIPSTFLVDENGTVIAKNLRGPALETKIAELLDAEEKTL